MVPEQIAEVNDGSAPDPGVVADDTANLGEIG